MNFIIMIIIIIIIMIIINLLKYINFLSLLNCSYNIENNIDLDLNLNKLQLFVSTHDYEHIDILILINEFIKNKTKITIVADDIIWNHILSYYLLFINVYHIKLLFVKKNTVAKIINLLKNNEKVLIYLSRNNNGKGIYYIIKQINIPITICKIKSNHKPTKINDGKSYYDIFINNINKKYVLRYENHNYNHNRNLNYNNRSSDAKKINDKVLCKYFIQKLKKKLYN